MGQDIQASEVHITAIEQVNRFGFGKQLVENVDVVNLASSHINIGRNAAPQIQQRVQFHRALAAQGAEDVNASGISWKAVGWRQKRSKKLKSKKLAETPYFCSIKQLR